MSDLDWEFINSFAPWFSALGTVSAVILSLYLTRKNITLSLSISAGVRAIASLGTIEKKHPEYCVISVVNTGFRKVYLTSICWEIGFLKKKLFTYLIKDVQIGDKIPKTLESGETASFFIPLEDFIKSFSPEFKKKSKRLSVVVCTSVGQSFKKNVEKPLQTFCYRN
jgi:hypothetical protein